MKRASSAHHDDRPAVIPCHQHTRQRVGNSRSGRNDHDGFQPTGHIIGRSGHQDRRLLMTRTDQPDTSRGTFRENLVHRSPGDSNNTLDTAAKQPFSNQCRPTHHLPRQLSLERLLFLGGKRTSDGPARSRCCVSFCLSPRSLSLFVSLFKKP